MFLSEALKLVRVNNSASAGQTTLTSTISRHGFGAALIIALLGDVADTSALALTAKLGDESNGSDAVAVTGGVSDFTAGASNADNKMLAVDVKFNAKDYLTWALARGTANAVVDGVIILFYDPKVFSITNDDTSLLELAKALAA